MNRYYDQDAAKARDAVLGSAQLFEAIEALIYRMSREHRVSGAFVRRWLDGRE